jgi:hypothetical protein
MDGSFGYVSNALQTEFRTLMENHMMRLRSVLGAPRMSHVTVQDYRLLQKRNRTTRVVICRE